MKESLLPSCAVMQSNGSIKLPISPLQEMDLSEWVWSWTESDAKALLARREKSSTDQVAS